MERPSSPKGGDLFLIQFFLNPKFKIRLYTQLFYFSFEQYTRFEYYQAFLKTKPKPRILRTMFKYRYNGCIVGTIIPMLHVTSFRLVEKSKNTAEMLNKYRFTQGTHFIKQYFYRWKRWRKACHIINQKRPKS